MDREQIKSTGDRFNKGKPQWSLLDYPSLVSCVRVLEFGSKKYSRDNWKKGLKVRETAESLLRHLYAMLDGEELDPESGLPHIGHVMCNAMFMSYMIKHRPDLNDLFLSPGTAESQEVNPIEF